MNLVRIRNQVIHRILNIVILLHFPRDKGRTFIRGVVLKLFGSSTRYAHISVAPVDYNIYGCTYVAFAALAVQSSQLN